jgi:UDP-galactopyranose mutase
MMQPLIVFSHLRWDFVYQRPQHLLTRLAGNYQVFYIEEPIVDGAGPFWEISKPAPNILVCRPHSPVTTPGFHDDQLPIVDPLIEALAAEHRWVRPVVWLYTPMALPLLARLDARLVVYDCMDELSAFKHAPRRLVQREHALLRAADLVFTGGPWSKAILSLLRSKSVTLAEIEGRLDFLAHVSH